MNMQKIIDALEYERKKNNIPYKIRDVDCNGSNLILLCDYTDSHKVKMSIRVPINVSCEDKHVLKQLKKENAEYFI